jgi:hypothetical protein
MKFGKFWVYNLRKKNNTHIGPKPLNHMAWWPSIGWLRGTNVLLVK